MEVVFYLTQLCAQEINQEYPMPMTHEAEYYNQMSANYPDETYDENYRRDDTSYR
jgi:hypothetical protein